MSLTPAKLCVPHNLGVLARQRLFDCLDEACRASGVWIWGPPGAGKTALAASYLEVRPADGGWMRLDASDADPASFFHFLALLAQAHWSIELPRFSREHLVDVEGFTRRMFRDLFARLPDSTIVVLDDYQEIPDSSPLHSIVRIALEEIPAAVNLLVLSRAPPHAEFARHLINGSLAEIDADALRFTEQETRELAKLRGLADMGAADAVNRKANGWVASVVLMLATEARGLSVRRSALTEGHTLLFQYFAQEVFRCLPERSQRVLLRTAFVSEISAEVAGALSGFPDAIEILEQIHSTQLFISRTGTPPTYQFHTLFAEFLRAEAKRRLGLEEVRHLLCDSAEALEKTRQLEEVVALYQHAGNWERSAQIILQCAPQLVAEGRGQRLIDWIEALPNAAIRGDAWLLFWLGMAQNLTDARQGRLTLIEAHTLFEARADIPGQTFASAGIVDSILIEAAAITDLDPWLDRLETLLSAPMPFLDLAAEAKVLTTTLLAHTLRRPHSPLARYCRERLQALLGLGLDANAEGGIAAALTCYLLWVHAFAALRELRARLIALAGADGISAGNRIRLKIALSAVEWFADANRTNALKYLDEAEQIGFSAGLAFLVPGIHLHRATLSALAGDMAGAEKEIDALDAFTLRRRPLDAARLHFVRALICFARKETAQALEMAALCIALAEAAQIGSVIFLMRLLRARILTELGRWPEAQADLALGRAHLKGGDNGPPDMDTPLLEAYACLRAGKESAALQAIARGLALARQSTARNLMLWIPQPGQPPAGARAGARHRERLCHPPRPRSWADAAKP